MSQIHQVTWSGSDLLHEPLQQTPKNVAEEVWRKGPVAIPTQKQGHSWEDAEGEAAIKENEGMWKVHCSPKIIRRKEGIFVLHI